MVSIAIRGCRPQGAVAADADSFRARPCRPAGLEHAGIGRAGEFATCFAVDPAGQCSVD
jgi:hypothetical protein